jgi:hypothetical protein
MIGTCLTVADLPENKAVWQGHDPADFETDIATLGTDYGAAATLAAQLATASTGPADQKDIAETVLEQLTFKLCRALANHFKKTGNLTDRAKVAVRIGAIQKLRDQALVDFATAVRVLATTASTDPDASNRGITAAKIAALTAAIGNFDTLKNAPRGNIVNRASLRRELETHVAALIEAVTDLDDLAIQFDEDAAGRHFITAWKNARIIIDAGHRPESTEEPTSAPTNP